MTTATGLSRGSLEASGLLIFAGHFLDRLLDLLDGGTLAQAAHVHDSPADGGTITWQLGRERHELEREHPPDGSDERERQHGNDQDRWHPSQPSSVEHARHRTQEKREQDGQGDRDQHRLGPVQTMRRQAPPWRGRSACAARRSAGRGGGRARGELAIPGLLPWRGESKLPAYRRVAALTPLLATWLVDRGGLFIAAVVYVAGDVTEQKRRGGSPAKPRDIDPTDDRRLPCRGRPRRALPASPSCCTGR